MYTVIMKPAHTDRKHDNYFVFYQLKDRQYIDSTNSPSNEIKQQVSCGGRQKQRSW